MRENELRVFASRSKALGTAESTECGRTDGRLKCRFLEARRLSTSPRPPTPGCPPPLPPPLTLRRSVVVARYCFALVRLVRVCRAEAALPLSLRCLRLIPRSYASANPDGLTFHLCISSIHLCVRQPFVKRSFRVASADSGSELRSRRDAAESSPRRLDFRARSSYFLRITHIVRNIETRIDRDTRCCLNDRNSSV